MEYEDLVDIDVASRCTIASRSTLGSLIPGDSVESLGPLAQQTTADDSSYVNIRAGIASPPSSLNTMTSTLSVGDMVVVAADGTEFNEFC